MKIKMMMALLVVAIALLGTRSMTTAQDAAAKDGKTIFTESKCSMCHAISSEGIETKKKGAPDLSDVGTKLKADFIEKYISKEEQLDGKKHPIAFKGEAADKTTLANWLESLKGSK
jgi:cytochrome c2